MSCAVRTTNKTYIHLHCLEADILNLKPGHVNTEASGALEAPASFFMLV